MIPADKIRGLEQILEEHGAVVFKNGSKVQRILTFQGGFARGTGTAGIGTHYDRKVQLVVIRPAGGIARFNESEIRRAYAMALEGPKPKTQPRGDGERFGDFAPW